MCPAHCVRYQCWSLPPRFPMCLYILHFYNFGNRDDRSNEGENGKYRGYPDKDHISRHSALRPTPENVAQRQTHHDTEGGLDRRALTTIRGQSDFLKLPYCWLA